MAEKVATRLEYWDARTGGWFLGAASIDLLHPERYAERLAKNGKIARAIIIETGEVLSGTPMETCPLCDDTHPGPFDGGCLL